MEKSQRVMTQNLNDDNTPTRFHKHMSLGCRVLPDVVAKTVVNPSVVTRRKQIFLSGTPVKVKSLNDLHETGNHQELQNTSHILFTSVDDKTSPGLAKLRMTPGVLREKQRRLIDQHEEIRQKGDKLKTGGGVSLWPEMQQMRLTQSEFFMLAMQAVSLCVISMLLLSKLHGKTSEDLDKFSSEIQRFCDSHNMSATFIHQQDFKDEIIAWHTGFLDLMNNIHRHFDMSAMSSSYQLYILIYLIGLIVLLYYLLDNMLSKSKLTPSRIKKWTCLLVVIGTWTSMMAYSLHLAYRLEQHAVKCVQEYSSSLAYLVIQPWDLGVYYAVLLYWRSRFLDNTSHGLLTVLGVISVKDLVYYLQYYSVPIGTVIISPVLKLCYTCLTVYGHGEYFKASSYMKL